MTSFVSELADPASVGKKRKTKGHYAHYSNEDRAKIGKYASENGNERANKKFRERYPSLTESTIRNFKKRYLQRMALERKKLNPEPVTTICNKERGRPPLLLELDDKLVSFLKAVRIKGEVVNIHVVRATAQALIASNPAFSQQFARFEMSRSWVQSVYRRMGLTIRAGTTSRPPVPQGIYDECQRDFLSDIKHKVESHSIPAQLVLNSDQTPSSYVSVGKRTMATKGAKSVPIKGLTDKRNITLTFTITLVVSFCLYRSFMGAKLMPAIHEGLFFRKDSLSAITQVTGPMNRKR